MGIYTCIHVHVCNAACADMSAFHANAFLHVHNMCVLLPSPRSSWYENAFLHVRIANTCAPCKLGYGERQYASQFALLCIFPHYSYTHGYPYSLYFLREASVRIRIPSIHAHMYMYMEIHVHSTLAHIGKKER